MFNSPSGSEISFKPVQYSNALEPITVTFAGISTFVKPTQDLNDSFPISVSVEGSDTLSSLFAFENVDAGSFVTPSGTTISSTLVQL